PMEDVPARGQVIFGVAMSGSVNVSGYTHIVLSIGDGEVIGLGSGGFERETVGSAFRLYWDSSLVQGPYGYGPINAAPTGAGQ
ncbi:hypothetical protein GN156_26355, partial [bacterium LRH843]|nr:hypothetical protein [bacterium LRH843]